VASPQSAPKQVLGKRSAEQSLQPIEEHLKTKHIIPKFLSAYKSPTFYDTLSNSDKEIFKEMVCKYLCDSVMLLYRSFEPMSMLKPGDAMRILLQCCKNSEAINLRQLFSEHDFNDMTG